MARTYAESVMYLMEKGGLTEGEAKARLDSRLKAPSPSPSPSRPTPAVSGAAAARPLAPTPAQTAPAGPLHPGEYTNVADIRRLDSPRALQVGKAVGEAAANPRAETLRVPLIEYLMPEERSAGSIRAQALGDLKRREDDFAQAPERRARAKESYERSLTEREDRLRAARREAEGAPPASDYRHPVHPMPAPPAPASPRAPAPAAKPPPAVDAGPPRPPTAAAPALVPAADWPGLGKADAYILSLKPGADLNQWSPEQRLAFYAERKAASSKE